MTTLSDLQVNDREELIYLLTEAAEFEHTVMCTYLYALWSLKRDVDDGVTAAELAAIEGWRQSILGVALEEMLHLSLVNNILAAIGAAPHFSRPDFPVDRGKFPADVDFHLAPFNEQSIAHFVFLERPEGIDVADGKGFVHASRYPRIVAAELLSPTPREYSSQGHLYHGIAQAVKVMADRIGEDALFIGHGEAQLGSDEFPLPGLFAVHDVESVMRAIEEIVSQGEGAPAHREDSHYARFAAIRDEYAELRAARPDFEPAWPAAVNPVLTEFVADGEATRITDPTARRLVDLGNCVYGLMVHVLAQVCAPAPLTARLRQGLADVSAELMRITTTVGEACARTPAGPDYPGRNAGITFALPRSFGPLVQANAAQVLAERAAELAAPAREVESMIPGVAGRLQRIAADLDALRAECAVILPVTGQAAKGYKEVEEAEEEPASFCALEAPDQASSDEITIYFDGKRCIHSRSCVLNAPQVFLANVEGPWLHPENDDPDHLAHVAMSCPSGAITYRRHDGGPQEPAPRVNYLFIRENGPYAVQARLEIENEAPVYRATLCRCGHSRNKPFCDNSHIGAGFRATGEPDSVDSDPLPERGGKLNVKPAVDGPLVLGGPIEICCGTGRTVTRTQATRLCRCGGSENKPFCDGSHRRIGFKSD
jgi:CDGSH-type Zn-finger protein/uncharacterized Fe-S cluster protein YjdI